MDYLDQVSIVRHDSWRHFEDWRREAKYRLALFTTKGAEPYLDHRYSDDEILLFGRESAGVPEEIATAAESRVVIPMRESLRSINLAMTVAMALGEALRQVRG
jgi:tRNA (cytidine/uridine-2'-O-)-methyltransferase